MSDASVNEVYGKEEQKGKARVRLGKWRVLTLKRPSDFLLPFCLRRIWHLSRLRFCALHFTNANIDERGEREDRGCFSSSLRIGKRGTGATLPPPNSRAEQMARARRASDCLSVSARFQICVVHSKSFLGQNAERRSSVGAVILFISGSFLKCKKLAFLPPRGVAGLSLLLSCH